MFLSVLVPSTYCEFFAQFVDSNLSAVEDWRLVFYQKNATALVVFPHEVRLRVQQTRALISLHHACADPRQLPEVLRQHGWRFDTPGVDYDLWSFDLNPYRLLDSVEEVIERLGILGCYWALHSFSINNVYLTMDEEYAGV